MKELKKGYFPHFFNTADNEHYVGPLPDKQHYGVDNMSRKEREIFIAWHDDLTSQGYVFDFRKELLEYCASSPKSRNGHLFERGIIIIPCGNASSKT